MADHKHKYEFGGPRDHIRYPPEYSPANFACISPGAPVIILGLPALLWALFFVCNDKTGCPAPATLSLSTFTFDKLKAETPWPADGIWGFCSWRVMGWTLAYYFLSLILYCVLPAQDLLGAKLVQSGRPLRYRFNYRHTPLVSIRVLDYRCITAFTSTLVQIVALAIANIILAYTISVYVYVASSSVKPGNPELRELASGGNKG
ncbi:delta(14)-sterol reductase [Colletotrichum spaethianum]|uniref:Delta(14)-sterol reductase n=1 Tax=Colletotrichum spaethianum TaxID=700344 RepID=A0AA37LDB0_9PEZI|nr:delta(14)-sterol reductase [Colletotrichum spaethianum]GKT46246.1 delta(14)-sterol reductase [Colletotrichum spaethianum]